MKKPPYVSHYLVLKDLINGVDVRRYSDTIVYLTSRIENIKVDLIKSDIEFIEDVTRKSKYSTYKPYVLHPSLENMKKAKSLLNTYATKEVLLFLSSNQQVPNEVNRENRLHEF